MVKLLVLKSHIKLNVCSVSFAKQFFSFGGNEDSCRMKKGGGEEKKGEKKAEYGAQESTEIELY